MFKRNFTFGLAYPSTFNDGAAWVPDPSAGSPRSWEMNSGPPVPVGSDGGDVSAIACAVNIFGQDDVFHTPYNGLCFNGRNVGGQGMCLRMACKVFREVCSVLMNGFPRLKGFPVF